MNTTMASRTLVVVVCAAAVGRMAMAQQPASRDTLRPETQIVPRLLVYGGRLQTQPGTPLTGIVSVTFGLHRSQDDVAALWTETQRLELNADGRFTVVLGATSVEGLPLDLFSAGEPRWLAIHAEGGIDPPRVLLTSVPYALKAADAQTLGGLPASAFSRARASDGPAVSSAEAAASASDTRRIEGIGTQTALAKFVGPFDIGDSVVFDVNGNVGIGTSTPARRLDVAGSARIAGDQTVTGAVIASSLSATSAINPVFAKATSPAGVTFGVSGEAVSPEGRGVYAQASALTGVNFGVFGVSQSSSGRGVLGLATSPNGSTFGVAGNASSPGGIGVLGEASAATGPTVGVKGQTSSVDGVGVAGSALATTGVAFGVDGRSNSTLGQGVFGWATAPTGWTIGAQGRAESSDGLGVFGFTPSLTGLTAGIVGQANSTSGTGVFGYVPHPSGPTIGVRGQTLSSAGVGVLAESKASTGLTSAVTALAASTHGTGVFAVVTAETGTSVGLWGRVQSPDGTAGLFENNGSPAGTILEGRANAVTQFRVNSAGKGFFNGGTQTGGADFAESLAVAGALTDYEPADVLVIDTVGARHIARSRIAYSTRVAGIYSTKPGVLATPHQMDDLRLAGEVPLAIIGIVPCKVTAENGPIAPGDLLVTSTLPGHAMKGTDRRRMLGAVVGKALEPLQSGTGIIQVLVTLQ
jgi:hypothetical protein